MSLLLDMSASVLRSKVIPSSLSYQLWQQVTKRSESKLYFFKTRLFGKSVTYGGVCGYSANQLFLELENYEAETVGLLKSILGPSPVIFDVGANNGMFLMICKALNPLAELHCFEPFPELSSFLRKLVEVNQFEGVKVMESIVGEAEGTGRLHFGKGATETASCVPDFQPFFTNSLETTKCTIDSYCERLKVSPTLLKIDVEGGELEVIKGAVDTLLQNQPDIILELLYPKSNSHQERQKHVLDILASCGYSFYQIRTDSELIPQSPVEPDPNYQFLNYLVTTKDVMNLNNREGRLTPVVR